MCQEQKHNDCVFVLSDDFDNAYKLIFTHRIRPLEKICHYTFLHCLHLSENLSIYLAKNGRSSVRTSIQV